MLSRDMRSYVDSRNLFYRRDPRENALPVSDDSKEPSGSVRLDVFLRLSKILGVSLTENSRILDFGCGEGHNTLALRRMGFRAFGCDVTDRCTAARAECRGLTKEEVFAFSPVSPYRLPYPDQMFDFIFSDHVMEHVLDYDATLAEMRRVLNGSGVALHIFPSRYRVLESHLKIPFGGVVTNPLWFALWQGLGQHRDIFPGEEITSTGGLARRNVNWVRSRLNYLSKRELKEKFGRYFRTVRFVESEALKCEYGVYVPPLSALISTFHARVVVLS